MNKKEIYFFFSIGCAYCKKAEPHIEKLNKEGYNVTKLDVADIKNKKAFAEIKKELDIKCGTPLFVDVESDRFLCGYRDFDTLHSWLEGADVPSHIGPITKPPILPLMDAKSTEVDKFKKEYKKWVSDNSHMENMRNVDDMLKNRPKTKPPVPPKNITDVTLKAFKKEYTTWQSENTHLKNLIDVDKVIQMLKQRANVTNTASTGVTIPHVKTINTSFYYMVENGKNVKVYADSEYIKKLQQTHYMRDTTGKLTKVVI